MKTIKRDSVPDLAERVASLEESRRVHFDQAANAVNLVCDVREDLRSTERYLCIAILCLAAAIILPDVAAYARGER